MAENGGLIAARGDGEGGSIDVGALLAEKAKVGFGSVGTLEADDEG